jgi:hypothetical protein
LGSPVAFPARVGGPRLCVEQVVCRMGFIMWDTSFAVLQNRRAGDVHLLAGEIRDVPLPQHSVRRESVAIAAVAVAVAVCNQQRVSCGCRMQSARARREQASSSHALCAEHAHTLATVSFYRRIENCICASRWTSSGCATCVTPPACRNGHLRPCVARAAAPACRSEMCIVCGMCNLLGRQRHGHVWCLGVWILSGALCHCCVYFYLICVLVRG